MRVVVPIVDILMGVELARVQVSEPTESLVQFLHFISPFSVLSKGKWLDMIGIGCSTIWSDRTNEEAVLLLGAGACLLVEGPVAFLAGVAAVAGLWFGTTCAGEGAWLGSVVGRAGIGCHFEAVGDGVGPTAWGMLILRVAGEQRIE